MGKMVTRIEDEISEKAYEFIFNRDGEEEANRWFNKVHNGDITREQLDRMINRPDIEPEDWRDFEDGWRPHKW